ncbi:protein takeout-like [Contarinia nasturtii]|uniref:protein takeout-like n=1 Tax=Contarinia nasturtii TaxID=265458 RepID=UPI0012D46CD7|nr:protein takeout-like [Contarinia nasturtii]
MKIILTVCTLILSGNTIAVQFPADVTKCRKGDGECIVQSANKMLREYPMGESNINLLSLDPLEIPHIHIEKGTSSVVDVLLEFSNNTISGFRDFTFYKIDGFNDTIDGKYEIQLKGPQIQLMGPYSVKGSVLFVPIQGIGDSNITVLNPDFVVRFNGKSITKNGETFLQPEDVEMSFTISELILNLDNLYGGSTTNSFLNRNWERVWSGINESVFSSFSQIAANILINVFSTIPYDELFTKENESL